MAEPVELVRRFPRPQPRRVELSTQLSPPPDYFRRLIVPCPAPAVAVALHRLLRRHKPARLVAAMGVVVVVVAQA